LCTYRLILSAMRQMLLKLSYLVSHRMGKFHSSESPSHRAHYLIVSVFFCSLGRHPVNSHMLRKELISARKCNCFG
jgi:hypothetical protein